MLKCLQADRQMDGLEGDHENTSQDFFKSGQKIIILIQNFYTLILHLSYKLSTVKFLYADHSAIEDLATRY